jgi:hypothetical protein
MEITGGWRRHRARIKAIGNQPARVFDDKCLNEKPDRRVHILGKYLRDYM